MKVLLICGVFAKENEEEVINHARQPVEISANVFQKKLISGFRKTNVDFSVLSAPFIGSFPNASDVRSFRGFSSPQNSYDYVSFNNIWGIRNLSRAKAFEKRLGKFISDPDRKKLIVVYTPHTPFLEAAVYAKRRDPNIEICMVVPDLPQFMNLNVKKSLVYRVGKKYDISKFNRLNRSVDSYMLLTESMADALDVGSRAYFVAEGIVTKKDIEHSRILNDSIKKDKQYKTVVYTGKMYEKFGVKDLVDAFSSLEGDDLRLVLCGRGDAEEYIAEKSRRDGRIVFLGQVPFETAREWMYKADILINPRSGNEKYTRYSFPSKLIEYLMTGNPVLAYVLGGMPEIYRSLLCPIDAGEDKCGAIAAALKRAMNICGGCSKHDFYEYAEENLDSVRIAERIIGQAYQK